MNKQKICIVGDGLSGLMSAIAINQIPGIEVNLIAKKSTIKADKRTTAISDTNFNFLKENISQLNNKMFWPSKNIDLFYETEKEKINFLNLKEKNNNLMYVFENNKVKKSLINEIKKKKVKVIRKDIKDLNELKEYDLSILCLGGNSKFYNNVIKSRSIKKDYNEIAITGYVKHNIKILNTSQFFLKHGPFAILPFSKNQFSFVWSLNKDFYKINSKHIKKIIKLKIQEILKSKQKINIRNFQSYPISLGLKRQYYNRQILILGEGIHSIHPVAGQGFNLVLRDIKKLKEVLKYYLGLGISIKDSFVLNDFVSSRMPENIIMGLGVDATHIFFKKNKYLDPFKGFILKHISNNKTLSKLSKIISNKGLSF